MTEHATDKFSGPNLISIRFSATKLAESAHVAFWMESTARYNFDFHRSATILALRELADLCGFDLVEKPADTIEDADLRGDMAAARAREMNAELPEAQRAVLATKGMI